MASRALASRGCPARPPAPSTAAPAPLPAQISPVNASASSYSETTRACAHRCRADGAGEACAGGKTEFVRRRDEAVVRMLLDCGLPLGVLVAVEDQPAGIREITGEFHTHRAELLTGAIEVVLVHHSRARDQPRVGGPGDRGTARAGPGHPLLFLRHPDIQHLARHQPPVIALRPPQVLPGDSVLALPPDV